MFNPLRALQSVARSALGIKSTFPELEAGRMARRLAGWTPSRAHVNTLIGAAGKTVVARARYLVRNNGYAARATDCFASQLTGTGIVPSWVLPDEDTKKLIQDKWKTWIKECDAEGVTNFYGLQRRVARERFIAGECFVRRRPRFMRDGLSVPLQLELLPSEQLPIERNLWLDNGNRVRQGIEFDQIGRRVAYHFWKVHPGDVTQSQNFGQITIVPASEILHIHDPLESGQIRGLPKLTPAIVRLFTMDALGDAQLERAKVAALFSVFIKRPEGTQKTILDAAIEQAASASGSDVATIDLQPGVAHQLMPGEEVTVADPAEVGSSYEPFMYRNLTEFCAAVGLPYSDVTGDTIKANYSSQRAAILTSRRACEAEQETVFVPQFCDPVAVWFLDAAVISGALKLKGYAKSAADYQNIDWIAPPWDWIDPLKDIQAEVIGVNAGFKPRSRVVQAEGYDPIENDNQIAADKQRADDLGLVFAGTMAPTKEVAAEPGDGDEPKEPELSPAAPPSGKPKVAKPKANGHAPVTEIDQLAIAMRESVNATREMISKLMKPATVVPTSLIEQVKVTKHDEVGRVMEFEKRTIGATTQ